MADHDATIPANSSWKALLAQRAHLDQEIRTMQVRMIRRAVIGMQEKSNAIANQIRAQHKALENELAKTHRNNEVIDNHIDFLDFALGLDF